MSEAALPVVLRVPQADRASTIRYFARRNPRMILGGALVLTWLALAVFAPFIAPYDPIKVNPTDALLPPSAGHLLGTDDLGRDMLSRILWGSRISLSVGLISVGIGFFVGVTLGLAAGYLGGTFDLVVMRGIDALLAFPALVLAIAITSALGPQIQNAMIAIGIVAIPGYARLTRGQVLAVKVDGSVVAQFQPPLDYTRFTTPPFTLSTSGNHAITLSGLATADFTALEDVRVFQRQKLKSHLEVNACHLRH